MDKYFGVCLEFDLHKIHRTIEDYIIRKEKGYVCVVDGVVLSKATHDKNYLSIINQSVLNICDGSSIALLAGKMKGKRFKAYPGPDLFNFYVEKGYRQCFLGNTPETMQALEAALRQHQADTALYRFLPLPFCRVDDFDYSRIAACVNEFEPDFIWVSLGAPKQEIFISKLYPFIKQGILLAIGAALNFYVGDEIKRAPLWMRKRRLEWVYRLISEPRKQSKRILLILKTYPKILFHEFINKR